MQLLATITGCFCLFAMPWAAVEFSCLPKFVCNALNILDILFDHFCIASQRSGCSKIDHSNKDFLYIFYVRVV